ncbi:phage holin [Anaerobacillus alkalilacustris]|uniref:Phage holin n=1 Tax=Anaerobacillus alkalilacustris TaxID=393763 RepID=A0A1S2LJV0_9BACI|nr:phage holin [Anaerobacillus alkalilacustris]OIJ12646.1 phage holin [Anaerobacillus alkalilacustris]
MKVNWKVRFKNPHFVVQVILAVLVPILAYMGLSLEDLTTWNILGNVIIEAIKNPYVLGLVAVSTYNAINDPTTKGFSDSLQALTYTEPREDEK